MKLKSKEEVEAHQQKRRQEKTDGYITWLHQEMETALGWMVAYQREKVLAQGVNRHWKARRMQRKLDEAKARYEKARKELSQKNPSIEDFSIK